jgi:hypothetical protein
LSCSTERCAGQRLALQNGEPSLDLIESRGVAEDQARFWARGATDRKLHSLVLAWIRATAADPDRVNPSGDAMALGHPVGAWGVAIKQLSHRRDDGGQNKDRPAATSQFVGIEAKRLPDTFDVVKQPNLWPDELAHPNGNRVRAVSGGPMSKNALIGNSGSSGTWPIPPSLRACPRCMARYAPSNARA